ncbi:peptidase [Neisseria dentiae]|nr:peptidase [Neisseria dentiae]
MMDTKKLVKASNIIGVVSIVLLVYWVFAFILIQVFGLKVFREHITEIFGLSILGVVALMAGALMLNIMLNLTRIAERGEEVSVKSGKKWLYACLLVFPLLAALLFGGNYLTAQQKQQLLIESAQRLIQNHPKQTEAVTAYRFGLPYIRNTAGHLELLEKQDSAFNSVTVIVPDNIGGTPVYLNFGSNIPKEGAAETAAAAVADNGRQEDAVTYRTAEGKQETLRKADYLHRADLREREYLQKVFQNQSDEIRFVSDNGRYELFYPYRKNGRTLAVFRLSDYQYYGKLGS